MVLLRGAAFDPPGGDLCRGQIRNSRGYQYLLSSRSFGIVRLEEAIRGRRCPSTEKGG